MIIDFINTKDNNYTRLIFKILRFLNEGKTSVISSSIEPYPPASLQENISYSWNFYLLLLKYDLKFDNPSIYYILNCKNLKSNYKKVNKNFNFNEIFVTIF